MLRCPALPASNYASTDHASHALACVDLLRKIVESHRARSVKVFALSSAFRRNAGLATDANRVAEYVRSNPLNCLRKWKPSDVQRYYHTWYPAYPAHDFSCIYAHTHNIYTFVHTERKAPNRRVILFLHLIRN